MRPSRAEQRIEVGRAEPSADLAGLVDYFWWVRWDTPDPHVQEVVPRPVVHVSAEVVAGAPRLLVHGVHPRMFHRRLEGSGHTVACERPEDGAGVLATWLRRLDPREDPQVATLAELVERVEEDTSLVRAEQVAELAGASLRTLQRRFGSYVGIGPKWVVQRFRLLDVTSAAHGEDEVDWAELAHRLGYADQSHLIRAFTQLVGHPPAAYAREA
ncbi:MAG: Helix-turn-helix, AraC domain protein [Nocardioides sp.]|nr:Helix-turn-helix, AraC domain protein [Nocardioides sp.]